MDRYGFRMQESEMMTSNASAPSFSGPALCAFEAHEVVKMLRDGDVSPRELLDASFARMDQVEPAINAVVVQCRDRAYAAADNLKSSNQTHAGWLGGLPIGIKDLTPVAGVCTTFGTAGLADFIPPASDPLVTRLEERGGIVTGKTNTPELGAGGNTFNDIYGPTRNPWNTMMNPAGSSGGAAASLATGESWLSHGSDHGGSLRTPAAYCGIVGLRPSPGRATGSSEAGFIIEGQQGPMARSVRDCALFLDSMAGHQPADPLSYPADKEPFQDAVIRAEGTLHIAYSPDFGGVAQIDEDMAAHLDSVMQTLERNGSRIEATCPDLSQLDRTYHVLRGLMWATGTRNMPEHVTRHFKQTLADNIAFGKGLSVDDIALANLERTKIYNAMCDLFTKYDVFACPVVGCMPHPVSEEWVRTVGNQELTGYMDWLRFAFLATTAGLPAISVPVGLGPEGMPVGMQLVGKPRGEAALLTAARIVEMSVGGPLQPIDPNIKHG